MKKQRCFISLDLPENVIDEIKRIQKLIKEKKLFDGKITESENLHLTLKFLGEIDEDVLEKVNERLNELIFKGFEARLGKIGVFSKKRIRIIWIELLGQGVFELQKKIDEALEGLFEKEYRFMSHITIARVKRVYDEKGFLEYLNGLKGKKIQFKVNEFYLKKSELFENGPVYEEILEYNLD